MKIHSRFWITGLLAVALVLMPRCDKKSTGPDSDADTAQAHFQQIQDETDDLPADAVLVYVGTDDADTNGDAESWIYVYYSPGSDTYYGYQAQGSKVSETDPATLGNVLPTTPIPQGWIDSQTALAVAEAGGGADFRAQYGNCQVEISLFMVDTTGMNLEKSRPDSRPADLLPIWEMWYMTDNAEAVGIVHGLTAELITFHTLYVRSGPITARECYNILLTRYSEFASGTLIAVSSSMTHPDGKNVVWDFAYRYGGQVRHTGMDGGVLHPPEALPAGAEINASWPDLPAGWIDTNQVLAIAEANGGAAYRTAHPNLDIEVHLFPPGKAVMNRNYPIWEVFYGVTPTEGFGIAMNALTGDLVQ